MTKVLAPPSTTSPLYEEDFPLWAERQATLLRARRFDELDLENLIEEVEDLSRRERDTVESHVETIMEHLVKLTLSPAERSRPGWLVTVDKQRAKLARKLTPTLRTHLEAELPTTGSDDPSRGSWRRTACSRMLCLRSAPTRSTSFSIRTGTQRTGTRQRNPDGPMLLIAPH